MCHIGHLKINVKYQRTICTTGVKMLPKSKAFIPRPAFEIAVNSRLCSGYIKIITALGNTFTTC